MSHEILKNDRVTLVGQPAWHGLGVVLPEAPTVREAFERTLPWDVELRPAFYDARTRTDLPADWQGLDRRFEPAPGQVVMAGKPGDWEPICVVGPDYKVVSNSDIGVLLEAFEDVSNGGEIETVGSLRGRRSCFALMTLGEYGVGLGGDDRTISYLAALWSHDGSSAVRLFHTTVRVVCANTFAAAINRADSTGAGLSIRHTGDVRERLLSAKAAIEAGNLATITAREEDRRLADTPVNVRQVGEYFARVSSILYPAVATERPEDPKEAAAWDRQRARARNVVGAWVEEFEHERQQLVAGTAYAAFEAVTYWADHQRNRVQNPEADKLIGRGAAIKQAAREAVLAMVGN